jgi:hypothetical protein
MSAPHEASCLHGMNESVPPNVEHSLMSGMQNLPTQADLMPPPDDGLNCYNSPQLSVEVGVTSIEAHGCGCVVIYVQLLVSLLDTVDFTCI